MDTLDSRRRIGFPSRREDWNKAEAVFDGHTLRIAGHPVMQDWELSYMRKLGQIASSNGGRILEVGYGLGLAARAIQESEIDTHFVIECHPGVVERCLHDFQMAIASSRLHVVSGFWEDITPLFDGESFDGILFDTYPLTAEDVHANHFAFFETAHRLLRPGAYLPTTPTKQPPCPMPT